MVEQLKRLSGVKFFLYARVRADEEDDVPLRLGNGDPLLLEHALGAGRVLLFASTIDNVWNDLPISPLFVPFAWKRRVTSREWRLRGAGLWWARCSN